MDESKTLLQLMTEAKNDGPFVFAREHGLKAFFTGPGLEYICVRFRRLEFRWLIGETIRKWESLEYDGIVRLHRDPIGRCIFKTR